MGLKNKISILGVNVTNISLEELLDYIKCAIQANSKSIISNINVHAVNLAYIDADFRNCINKSDLVFCDGFGVKIAVKIITGVTLYRYTPPDWFDLLVEQCVQRGDTLFFLGTKTNIIEKVAELQKEKFPRIKIVGTHHGYFDKSPGSVENNDVVARINCVHPDILVVGFGMPLQEKWISENFNILETKVIIPVGAYFDYAANATPRAPRWMTDHGLEWLGRLIIEPKRLWKRYLIGNPLFFWRVFRHHILKIPLPFKNCVE